MINYLYANNFKSFVNFKVEFNRLNLMIGKNGSGKSNVFTLIFSLVEMVRGSYGVIDRCFPYSSLTRWMKSNIQTFEMGLSDDDHTYVYKIEIKQNSDSRRAQVIYEKISRDNKVLFLMENGSSILYDDSLVGASVLTNDNISGVSFVPLDGKHTYIEGFKKAIFSIILCSPDPRSMVANVGKEELGAMVNFSNIASIYAGLLQTDPEMYGDLMSVLKDINPYLNRFKITMSPMGRFLVAEYCYNDVSSEFYFDELSDGEKMVFALYLILFGFIKKGYTVLMDEPDNYLSLREIQPWCSEIESEVMERGQCIMISHHPEIIDYLAVTNGIWISRIKSGESIVVDDQKKAIDNKDLLTYSEFIARGLMDEAQ